MIKLLILIIGFIIGLKASAQDINSFPINDVVQSMSKSEGILYGRPNFDWAKTATIGMGIYPRGDASPTWWNPANKAFKSSEYWTAIAPWFVIWEGEDNLAKNVRVNVYGFELYFLDKNTNKWVKLKTTSTDPSWANNFGITTIDSTTMSGPANVRKEADGTLSYKLTNRNPVHGGFSKYQMSLSNIDIKNIKAIYGFFKTKLVVDDPKLENDLSKAKILIDFGADYYPSMQTMVKDYAPMTYAPQVAGSRFSYVYPIERVSYLATLDTTPNINKSAEYLKDGKVNYITASDLLKNPPPFPVKFVVDEPTKPKLLFKSDFAQAVMLDKPRNYYPNKKGAWQDLKGKDNQSGFTWSGGALDSDFMGIQYITYDDMTPENYDDLIHTEVRQAPGPCGLTVPELFISVKKKAPVGTGVAQAPLLIRRDYRKPDVTDLYVTYWFKFRSDLASKLDANVSSGNWQALFEFKTGGYKNTGNGDFRIQTTVIKSKDGKLHWLAKADTNANAPTTEIPLKDFWIYRNYDVPVPVGKWFKFEAYWMRDADGTKGRYWNAIDGKVLFDVNDVTLGEFKLPVNRLFVVNPYSGGNPPVDAEITGLEIWNTFPCGQFRSCYQK